jgi:DNA-binding transcriptional ArsR family regulator
MKKAHAMITREEFQTLIGSISRALDAISDGRIVIEDRPTAQPGDGTPTGSSEPPPRRSTGHTGPRVLYALASPNKGKMDLKGLTPSETGMAKYLAVHDHVPVQELMKELKLQRSTVMNGLKKLRKRGIARSVPAIEVRMAEEQGL